YTNKRKAEEEYIVIAPKRHFASANEAYPDFNFYVEPEAEVKKVAELLLECKFTLLFGHRQSGKSTTCHAILRWFYTHLEQIREAGFDPQELEIYFVTFNANILVGSRRDMFWKSICKKFKLVDNARFNFDNSQQSSGNTFMRFFAKDNPLVQSQAIIIIDEASRLTSNDDEATMAIITEFIDSLRTLKGDRDNFRLHSLLLCGTANIRDLLLARQRPGSMSSISPFSEEASLTSNRFTETEVRALFTQFADTNNTAFDIVNIAADIFDLTLGHKGLVGACGDYIQNTYDYNNTPIITLDDWKRHTPVKLLNRILQLST
ncbi:1694_t:CDS:2, partial [Paraglomus brasilianum]